MKHYITLSALVATLLLAAPAAALANTHGSAQATVPAQATLTEGEVRRVDKDTKKITIRHGAIANLDMPPMTMVFQVKDPAMVEQVKAGDRIRFSADKVNGAYTVTAIEADK